MKDWYQEKLGACGNVQSWVHETVHGKDFTTRAPHFRGFIVCSETIDGSSIRIVREALRSKQTVLAFNTKQQLLQVTDLFDDPDFEDGEMAVCGNLIRG